MIFDDIPQLIRDLDAFDPQAELEGIVQRHIEALPELQRDQMVEGKGVDGEWIRPYYSENPYFPNRAAAEKYANWKQVITPNPQRPKDVPNLTINYRFHNSIYGVVRDGEFDMEATDENAEDIWAVHKNAKGLNEEKRLLFAEAVVEPEIKAVIKDKIGLDL